MFNRSLAKYFFRSSQILLTLGLFLVLVPRSGTAQSSDYSFLDTEQGLSNNWVSQITQDSLGYIWVGTQYGLNKYDGYGFESFTHNPNDSTSLIKNWVKSMAHASDNSFWLGIDYGGVDQFDLTEQKVEHFEFRTVDNKTVTTINKIHRAQNGTVYVGSTQGLFHKPTDKHAFSQINELKVLDIAEDSKGSLFFLTSLGVHKLVHGSGELLEIMGTDKSNQFISLITDHKDIVWALRKKDLLQLSQHRQTWKAESISMENRPISLLFAQAPLFEDHTHRIWIGGKNGITLLGADRKTIETIPYSTMVPSHITHCRALTFFEDKHKNMWIGTNQGLVFKSSYKQRFSKFPTPVNSFNDKTIREFIQTEGLLWIASANGLYNVNMDLPHSSPKKILDSQIYSLCDTQDGYLYAVGQGFFRINLSSGEVKSFENELGQHIRSWSIVQDRGGRLWLSTRKSLVLIDPIKEHFVHFPTEDIPTLHHILAPDLLIDSKGRLWGTSLKSGVYLLEAPHKINEGDIPVFKNFSHVNGSGLSNDLGTYLTEDPKGNIWVATDAGLNKIDGTTYEIKSFLKQDGLLDEKIMGLVADDDQNIWGSTSGHGIFRFADSLDTSFTFFNKKDGLVGNNFLLTSAYKDDKGILFFGSDNGVQTIDPLRLKQFKKPTIKFGFTKITTPNDQKSTASQDRFPLLDSLFLELPYHKNSLNVNYTTINFDHPTKTIYSYKIDGIHQGWQSNGTLRNIPLIGLSPGRYVLSVKAENSDVDFSSKSIFMHIAINPPWWQTTWAYLLYALLLIGFLIFLYRHLLRVRLQRAEASRLKKLNEFRSRLYTNIAHEFKTPLTLIADPIQQYLTKEGDDPENEKIKLVTRNVNRLTQLVDQLLHLAKLEEGSYQKKAVYGDLASFIKTLIASHAFKAKDHSIKIDADIPSTPWTWYDADMLEKVIGNLLGNAIKYSPKNSTCHVSGHLEDTLLELRFTNPTHEKINPKKLFKRFYQANPDQEGVGIGLAFVKELVTFFKGTISVTIENSLIHFVVTFHIGESAFSEKELSMAKTNYDEETPIQAEVLQNPSDKKGLPHLLIVEDDRDTRKYIANALKGHYHVIEASNGQKGFEKAVSKVPEIIITDIRMPVLDGIELCNRLKNDQRTSHIPVLVLTATSNPKNELKALQFGADAYINKPFQVELLAQRIHNLVATREKWAQRYHQKLEFPSNTNQLPPVEQKFLGKVDAVLRQAITDPNFNATMMSQHIGMSRMQLHRKLQAHTGMSTTAFIRSQRLKLAVELLKRDLSVKEVAYSSGFNSSDYFIKSFKAHFQRTPSEFRNQLPK